MEFSFTLGAISELDAQFEQCFLDKGIDIQNATPHGLPKVIDTADEEFPYDSKSLFRARFPVTISGTAIVRAPLLHEPSNQVPLYGEPREARQASRPTVPRIEGFGNCAPLSELRRAQLIDEADEGLSWTRTPSDSGDESDRSEVFDLWRGRDVSDGQLQAMRAWSQSVVADPEIVQELFGAVTP